jgi:Secretion system C-terminal sorting domain
MNTFLRFCFFLFVPFYSTAQWSNSATVNTPVETTAGCAADTFASLGKAPLVRDAAGNYFVTWSDNRTTPYQVYVQKLNANGQAQWTVNGVIPAASTNRQVNPEVATDENGGCFVSWSEEISTQNRDIKIQRLNASGVAQWGAGGVIVCNAINQQDISKVVSDGANGVFVAWFDSRAENPAIYAQRLNNNGTVQWVNNGIQVNNTTSLIFYDEFNLLQENTNVVLVWDELLIPSVNIAAQKLSSTGSKLWGASGITVTAGGLDLFPSSRAVIDASGNVYVVFLKEAGVDNPDVYAQKFNTSGVSQWTTGGVVVCNAPALQVFPELALDNSGGIFVGWTDDRDNDDVSAVFVQRINSSGTAHFASNGIELVTTPAAIRAVSKLVPDGSGGAIISFYDGRALPTSIDIYSQRINTSGVAQWAAGGVFTARPVNNYDEAVLQSMVAADNGAVIGFFDNRVTNNGCWDVYLQRINSNGTLGNNPTSVTNLTLQQANIKLYPTVTSKDVLLENNNSYIVSVRIVDITGKQVMNRLIGRNSKQIIDLNYLNAGVYFAEIQLGNGKRVTEKIIKR